MKLLYLPRVLWTFGPKNVKYFLYKNWREIVRETSFWVWPWSWCAGQLSVYSDSDDSDSFTGDDMFGARSQFHHQSRHRGQHQPRQPHPLGLHPQFMFPPPPPGPPPPDAEMYITCKSWCCLGTVHKLRKLTPLLLKLRWLWTVPCFG